MADFWKIAATCVVVLGWMVAPVITALVNKHFTNLSVDLAQELMALEVCTILTLKKMLTRVQKLRIEEAAKKKVSESDDLKTLDQLGKYLRSALYDAEDILDFVEYHRIEKERCTWWQRLGKAVGVACIARCCKRLFGQLGRSTVLAAVRLRMGCSRGLDHLDQQLLQLWRRVVPRRTPEEEEQQPSPDLEARSLPLAPRGTPEEEEQQPSPDLEARCLPPADGREASFNFVLRRLHSCFLATKNCCGSILSWLVYTFQQLQYLMGGLLRGFLDWLSEVVGIKHNKKDGIGLDSFQLLIYGKSLRKRMKHIESVITVSKESLLLLNEQSSSKLFVNDTDKESSSSPSVQDKEVESRRKRIKEIADVHTDIAQPEPVFGREKDQKDVCKLLRKGPNSCYSVICILGIAGSGKTTLARYVCDYEKKLNNKHFDPIMFIEVSKTFRLHDIFIDMLTEISGQDGQSSRNESQCEELTGKSEGRSLKSLCAELKEELKGKRFLLVLDDLWVIDENRKEMDILLDVLTSGNGGSRILVTAQKEVAGVGPYAPKNFKIGKLEPKYYLSLFLHYAGLPDVVDDDSEFKKIGSKIAEKLHRSPRAAVTVARRLWGASISTWETTANLDELNGTMEALWWSYEQLSLDIRRCFEYCCIFPRGCKFDRVELVRMWIAQGFVSTRSKKEEPEDVGQRYFDELLAFSFFSRTPFARFTIHDLLYELVERVAGSDFLRIGVNGFDSRQGIPSEVRHLSIDTYDRWEMTTEQILELENLRTLIIEEKYHLDEYTTFDDEQPHNLIEEKLLDERIFKKMRKLRVLIVILKYRENRVFSISESIGQMKHLRLFHFYCRVKFRERENIFTVRSGPPKMNLILPNTFSQLYQMQDIELLFSGFSRWKKKVHSGIKVSLPEDLVDNLIQLRRLDTYAGLPNIGGLTSLQSAINFDVKKEEGYELKQLKHLNKLRGLLHISGLKNVRSKDEALEGNLTSKTRLTKLVLNFIGSDPNMVEDVLEGLLPPKDLKKLIVLKYRGSWCPSWMCQNPDAPKNLGRLILYKCSQLVHIPEGSEFFAGLRCLTIWFCIWDALPDHMERLSSLKKLEIWNCDEIELLPTRPPPSLEISIIGKKNKLWKSLQEEKHENRQRFEVVSSKELNQYTFAYGVPIQLICRPFRNGRQVTVLTPSTSPAAVISSQPCPTTNGEIEELQDI